MDFHERKRYYRITLHYEKQEFMQEEYGITYKDIENKIKYILVPQLLSHITRVKKRNELRAEIKRTHHTEK